MLSVKDQLPFATSKALNDAAKAVRETIVEKTYPQSFEPKSKGFAKAAFFRAFANKRKLEARVFDRFEKDYLVNQAKGGVKKKEVGSLLFRHKNDQRSVAENLIIECILEMF